MFSKINKKNKISNKLIKNKISNKLIKKYTILNLYLNLSTHLTTYNQAEIWCRKYFNV